MFRQQIPTRVHSTSPRSIVPINLPPLQEPRAPATAATGSELTVYFQVEPTSVGNGIAYYNVIVNGTTILTNQVTSTTVGVGNQDIDSVSFTCPAAGSTIVIQPANGAGGSASLPAEEAPGEDAPRRALPTTVTRLQILYGTASTGVHQTAESNAEPAAGVAEPRSQDAVRHVLRTTVQKRHRRYGIASTDVHRIVVSRALQPSAGVEAGVEEQRQTHLTISSTIS